MNYLPEKNKDPLKKLLRNEKLEQPSLNFTTNVLDKLGIAPPTPSVKYEPVISKKGWFLISAVVISILWMALTGSSGSTVLSKSTVVDDALGKTTSIFLSLTDNSFVFMICMLSIAVFMLVSAESLYRQSRLKTT